MHRLFYGDISQGDGWVHLIEDNQWSNERVNSFLARYFDEGELLLFVNANKCESCLREQAPSRIIHLVQHGRIKIADEYFRSRMLIHPTGVGVAQKCSSLD
jgi:hypothetical protein